MATAIGYRKLLEQLQADGMTYMFGNPGSSVQLTIDLMIQDFLEKAVAERFANVTAIRTREAIEAVNGLVARIGWGVRTAAAVTLVAGALVLAGAIAADRQRRDYETVLFKVLGATRGRIARLYVVEYGLLGMITAVIEHIEDRDIEDYLLQKSPRFRKMLAKVKRERSSISLAAYRKSRNI